MGSIYVVLLLHFVIFTCCYDCPKKTSKTQEYVFDDNITAHFTSTILEPRLSLLWPRLLSSFARTRANWENDRGQNLPPLGICAGFFLWEVTLPDMMECFKKIPTKLQYPSCRHGLHLKRGVFLRWGICWKLQTYFTLVSVSLIGFHFQTDKAKCLNMILTFQFCKQYGV